MSFKGLQRTFPLRLQLSWTSALVGSSPSGLSCLLWQQRDLLLKVLNFVTQKSCVIMYILLACPISRLGSVYVLCAMHDPTRPFHFKVYHMGLLKWQMWCAARAESWFGSQELALPEPHGDYPLMPYCPWASLAGNLTHLELGFHQPVTGASILPLSQLTRLKSLSLQTNGWSADVDLSLPQLQKLQIINAAQHADITLNCLQLKTLVVESATPLEAFEGIPPGIEDISFSCLEDGSLSLHEMLWERELDQLKSLRVFMSPEFQSYDSPEASRVIKQVLRKGRLTTLVTDCPVEQLTPSAGAQCALLMSLQILELHLPLDKGIPEVLEQLTNLRSLTLVGPKWEPMHLTRSLDPFLNMKDLGCLAFMGKPIANDHALQIHFEWTPDAMEVILLARMRLQGSRRSQMLCC